MVNEVKMGLDYLNQRQGTNYNDPEDVVMVCEELAAKMVAGEPVDFDYDDYRMAVSLFVSGGIMRPLESSTARKASELWLNRHSRRRY